MLRARHTLIASGLLLGGCATDAIRTSEQALAIAQTSSCAQLKPVWAPGEEMGSIWLAERRGERWYAWLPYGNGARLSGGNGQFPTQFGHMGAWIDPTNGKILACERVGAEP